MQYIPIVDLFPVLDTNSATEPDWNLVSRKVGNALNQVGFVYLKNHGVAEEKINSAFAESRKFFELSTAAKLKYRKDPKVSLGGYAEPGQEILDAGIATELRESFDLKHDEAGPTVQQVPDFISSLRCLEAECKPLIVKLLKIFSRALELDNENYFIEASKNLSDSTVDSYTTFRSIYYPTIPKEFEIKPGTVRCAPHSDYGILTLLFQDDIGGLEVKTVDDTWVGANPIPNTILINTGDLLEFWSGGYFPATNHRILVPDETEVRQRNARQSIVYFVHPDDATIVAPLKSDGVQFQPVSARDHAKMKLDRSYKY